MIDLVDLPTLLVIAILFLVLVWWWEGHQRGDDDA